MSPKKVLYSSGQNAVNTGYCTIVSYTGTDLLSVALLFFAVLFERDCYGSVAQAAFCFPNTTTEAAARMNDAKDLTNCTLGAFFVFRAHSTTGPPPIMLRVMD